MNEEQLKRIENSIENGKIKIFKDLLKEISLETEISDENYLSFFKIALKLSKKTIVNHLLKKKLINQDIIESRSFLNELSEKMKIHLIGNINTPSFFIEEFARSDDHVIKLNMAEDKSTSPYILNILAFDEYYIIRDYVARNPNVAVKSLEALSKDEDNFIREKVAGHKNTPVNILEVLSKDKKYFVVRKVAQNPSTPDYLLKELNNEDISKLEELASDEDIFVKMALAKNPNTPSNLLEKLYKDGGWIIESLTENPSTPLNILEKLAKSSNSDVRSQVAKNPSIPLNILEMLAKDKESRVKRIALEFILKRGVLSPKEDSSEPVNSPSSSDSSLSPYQKLEEAVSSKKLKLFKDALKEVSTETQISIDDYKKLALLATDITATPILKHIFKLIEPEKELLSECFLIAIENNKIKVVEYLLELGADINKIDKYGANALIISVKNNKPKSVDFFLESNIDINFKDNKGNTALHHAISMKKSKIVEALIDKNADLNIENNNGLVPLAFAWNLDVTPAVIDLLFDKDATNMIDEAGQKVMNEAFKISKGRKKDQRKKMKDLYLKNRVSDMSKENFIKKHGKIYEIDSYIKALKAPNGEDIMKGIFTNIGYFPKDTNFIDMEHNWEAIDYAIELSNRLAEILKDTHSLHSEGESYYKPFFIPEVLWVDLADFDAKATRDALDEAHDAYNKWPTSFGFYKNIFSEDIKEDYEDMTISEEEYKAFTKASKLMEKELVNLYSLQMYPSFIEFPWFFLGIDKYRNLVGVVTSAVWT